MAFTDLHTIRDDFDRFTNHERVTAGDAYRSGHRGAGSAIAEREQRDRDRALPKTKYQLRDERRAMRAARAPVLAYEAPLPSDLDELRELLRQLRAARARRDVSALA
jgi:hypothetical protein